MDHLLCPCVCHVGQGTPPLHCCLDIGIVMVGRKRKECVLGVGRREGGREGRLPACRAGITLTCSSIFTWPPRRVPVCVQTASFYEDTSHVRSGPALMTSFQLGSFCKDPVATSGHILGCWALGPRHRNLGTSLTGSLVLDGGVPTSRMRTPRPREVRRLPELTAGKRLLRWGTAPRGLPPVLVSAAVGYTKLLGKGKPGPRRLLQ